MFALGWKELLCVAVYAAFVWAGHSLLRVASPLPKSDARRKSPPHVRADLLRALLLFAVSWLPALLLAKPLWTAVTNLATALPQALPLVHLSPSEPLVVTRLNIPCLLAIVLSSPAWIYLIARLADPDSSRSSVLPACAFVLGCILGYALIPAASPLLLDARGLSPYLPVRDLSGMLWDMTLGTGLLVLTPWIIYRAATGRLLRLDRPVRRWIFLTPSLMLIAAVVTAAPSPFRMTLVFLPMCVAAMAGIGMAEVVTAHSLNQKLEFSRIGGWGLRLMAESVLGALIAAAIIVLWR